MPFTNVNGLAPISFKQAVQCHNIISAIFETFKMF